MIRSRPPLGLCGMTRLALALGLLALLLPASALTGGHASSGGEASIFYYPWYGTPQRDGSYQHWDQNGHIPPLDLASSYYPARGPYSSSDPAVVQAQMRDIAGAGIREVVSSWWGVDSIEDQRLPMIVHMATKQDLGVAVQIEPYDGRTAASVASDIAHLRPLGISRFYVYHPFDIDEASWAALLPSLPGIQVLAQTVNVARAQAAHFAGVYTYDVATIGPATFAPLCARARRAGMICAPSVGPGYDALRATGDTHFRVRNGGATYDAMWQAAIRAGADRITITSYNEWHEGTQIEPAVTRLPRTVSAAGGRDSSPVTVPYSTYDGAYGMHGSSAPRAYLTRTAYWTALYRDGRIPARAQARTGKVAAQGRKPTFRAEGDPVAITAVAPSSIVQSRSKGRPGASFRGSCSNLLSGAMPSRLMAAVRVTAGNTVVRPLGRDALWKTRVARGRSCYRGHRPLALLGMSVITRCASSSGCCRSACTRRTASRTVSYWGNARRSKGG
jgi:glycoprotein endo-alpha-1,2-mannosidase